MHEAHVVQEGPRLLSRVVEREAPREIDRPSGLVLNRSGMIEVEERLFAQGGPQGRLPPRQLAEAPVAHRQLVGVEKGETRLELPDELHHASAASSTTVRAPMRPGRTENVPPSGT